MATVEFLPFAADTGANVATQSAYAGSGYQVGGMQPGLTLSAYFNKGVRQGAAWASVLANFVAAITGDNVLDSGYASAAAETTTLLAQFQAALALFVRTAVPASVTPVAFTTTPVFDCSAGNLLQPVFEITLAADAVASFSNVSPGQVITVSLLQDSTGGHALTYSGDVENASTPDTTANTRSVQMFYVASTSAVVALTGMAG